MLTNKLIFFLTRLVKMVDLREKLTSYIRSSRGHQWKLPKHSNQTELGDLLQFEDLLDNINHFFQKTSEGSTGHCGSCSRFA